jgi:hypothetical protein
LLRLLNDCADSDIETCLQRKEYGTNKEDCSIDSTDDAGCARTSRRSDATENNVGSKSLTDVSGSAMANSEVMKQEVGSNGGSSGQNLVQRKSTVNGSLS